MSDEELQLIFSATDVNVADTVTAIQSAVSDLLTTIGSVDFSGLGDGGQLLDSLAGQAQSAAQSITDLGSASDSAGTSLDTLTSGDGAAGLTDLGSAADSAGSSLDSLGSSGDQASTSLDAITGGDAAAGLADVDSGAQASAASLDQLATSGDSAGQALETLTGGDAAAGLTDLASSAEQAGAALQSLDSGGSGLADVATQAQDAESALSGEGEALSENAGHASEASEAMGVFAGAIASAGVPLAELSERFGQIGEGIVHFATEAEEGGHALDLITAGATGLAVAIGGEMANKFVELTDSVHEMSETTGTSTDTVQGLGYALKTIGDSADEAGRPLMILERNAGTLQATLDAGKAPTGRFADAIKELGISVQDFVAMDPDTRIRAVMDAFSQLGEEANKTQIAMDLFGRSGASMIGVLEQGSAAIDTGIDKTNQYGASVANAWPEVQKFHTAQADLSTAIEGFVGGPGSAILPMITGLEHGAAAAVGAFNQLPGPIKDAAGALALMGTGGLAAVTVIGTLAPAVTRGISVLAGLLPASQAAAAGEAELAVAEGADAAAAEAAAVAHGELAAAEGVSAGGAAAAGGGMSLLAGGAAAAAGTVLSVAGSVATVAAPVAVLALGAYDLSLAFKGASDDSLHFGDVSTATGTAVDQANKDTAKSYDDVVRGSQSHEIAIQRLQIAVPDLTQKYGAATKAIDDYAHAHGIAYTMMDGVVGSATKTDSAFLKLIATQSYYNQAIKDTNSHLADMDGSANLVQGKLANLDRSLAETGGSFEAAVKPLADPPSADPLVSQIHNVTSAADLATTALENTLNAALNLFTKPSSEEVQLNAQIADNTKHVADLNLALSNTTGPETHIAELRKAYDASVRAGDGYDVQQKALGALNVAIAGSHDPRAKDISDTQGQLDAALAYSKALQTQATDYKATRDDLAANTKARNDESKSMDDQKQAADDVITATNATATANGQLGQVLDQRKTQDRDAAMSLKLWGDSATAVANTVENAMPEIANSLDIPVNKARDAHAQWDAQISGLPTAVDMASASVQASVSNMGSALEIPVSNARDLHSQWDETMSGIGQDTQSAGSAVSGSAATISTALLGTGTEAIQAGDQVGTGTDAMGVHGDAAAGKIRNLHSVWSSETAGIGDDTKSAADSVGTATDQMGTDFTTAGSTAKTGGDTASHAFDAVPGAVQTAIAPVPGIVQSTFASAGSGAAGEGESIGEAFGAGIASGISAVTGAVAAAAAAVVTTAVTAAKAAAAIASPSRRTEDEIGLPISQGIAQGILAGVTNVNAAMGVVVGSAIEAGQQASSGMDLAQVRRGLTAGAMAEVFPSGAGNLAAPNLDALVQPWHAAQGDITAILGQLGQAEAALTAAQGQQQALQAQSAQLAAQQSYKAWQDAITQYGAGSLQAEQAGISYQQSLASANTAAAQSSEQAWQKYFDDWMARAQAQSSFAQEQQANLAAGAAASTAAAGVVGASGTHPGIGTPEAVQGSLTAESVAMSQANAAIGAYQATLPALTAAQSHLNDVIQNGGSKAEQDFAKAGVDAAQTNVTAAKTTMDAAVSASQTATQRHQADVQALNQSDAGRSALLTQYNAAELQGNQQTDQQIVSLRQQLFNSTDPIQRAALQGEIDSLQTQEQQFDGTYGHMRDTAASTYDHLVSANQTAMNNIQTTETEMVGQTDPLWLQQANAYIDGQNAIVAANNTTMAHLGDSLNDLSKQWQQVTQQIAQGASQIQASTTAAASSAGGGGGGGGGGQIGPNGRIVGNVIVGGPNAGSTDPGGGYHVEGTAINPGVIQGQMDAQNMLASIDNFHGAVTGLAGTLETGLEKLGFTQSDALEHAIEVAIAGGAKLGFSNPTDTANQAFEAWSSISQIGPQNPASIARLINQLHGAGFDASTAHQWDQPANLAATQAEQYTLSAYQRTGNVGSYDTLLAQIAARSGGSNTVANTSPSNLANSIADAWWSRSQGRGSQQIVIQLDGATIYRGTANAQYGDIQMRQGAAA